MLSTMMLSSSARLVAATARSRAIVASSSTTSMRFYSPTDHHDDELTPWNSREEVGTEGEWAGCRRNFMAPIQISARGGETLNNPLYNKGTAFKSGERDRLRFRGLLPHRIMNIYKQKERFLRTLRDLDSNIRKNLLLEDLHDRNETLYHRILVDHMEEMAPYVYTPTVGQACQEYATRFRRPRGMYFSEEDRGQMGASKCGHMDISYIL
jgi:hypothetical protein